MLDARPPNQFVGQLQDGARTATAVGQVARQFGVLRQEALQEAGVGAGEGGVDRLVRIPDAHPVAVAGRQQPQHALLRQARILGLVLQDERPARPQPFQVSLVRLQRPQRQQDEVVEVDGAAQTQAALVIGVDVQAKLQQRPGARLPLQAAQQLVGRRRQLLGDPNHGIGDVDGVVKQGLLDAARVLQILRLDEGPECVRAGAEVAQHRLALDLGGRPLVDDIELFAQADQAGPLADDVVGQAVERAHAVAHAGQQALLLAQEAADAARESWRRRCW